MTIEEAEQLVEFLRSAPNWGPQINDDQAAFYVRAISTIDATIASKAIIDGIGEWRFAPSLAQIYERVKAEKVAASHRDAFSERYQLPEAEPIPQWVFVWNWLRTIREVRDMRRLPMQTGEAEMTDAEYHDLEREWISEGAPKPRNLLGIVVREIADPDMKGLLSGP